jgi:hypothetical protein
VRFQHILVAVVAGLSKVLVVVAPAGKAEQIVLMAVMAQVIFPVALAQGILVQAAAVEIQLWVLTTAVLV